MRVTLLTLPNEIFHEILREWDLDFSDLRKCCLINHRFLLLAQRILYQSIKLFIQVPEIWMDSGHLDKPGRSFLDSLKENRFLGECITHLELETVIKPSLKGSRGQVKLVEVLQECIGLMPRLNSLRLRRDSWASNPVRELVFSRGEQWTALDVDGEFLDPAISHNRIGKWSELPNLRKVRCRGLFYTINYDDPIRALPSTIDTLDLIDSGLPSIPPRPNSTLRVLRHEFSEYNLVHLDSFRQLQHLILHQDCGISSIPKSTLTAFSTLPFLRSLSILLRLDWPRYYPTAVEDLLENLPPLTERHNFPAATPFQLLTSLIQTKQPKRLCSIGFGCDYVLSPKAQSGLEELREVGKEKGIELCPLDDLKDTFLT